MATMPMWAATPYGSPEPTTDPATVDPATVDPATVDISVPDLMDVIDQHADAAIEYAESSPDRREYRYRKMTNLRASIERMLSQEKTARRALEAKVSS